MKIFYEADDGKQFDDEQECKEYEEKYYGKFLNELNLYKFYDTSWNPIEARLDNLEQVYNDAAFIKVLRTHGTDESELEREYGINLPFYEGTYRYDSHDCVWKRLDSILSSEEYAWGFDKETIDAITKAVSVFIEKKTNNT